MEKGDDKNTLMLTYNGVELPHNISNADVAEYVASRLALPENVETFRNHIKDTLALLDMAFGIRNGIGYVTLFGTKSDFRWFLLSKLKKEES